MAPPPRGNDGEHGFVLIAVMWLMVLAGSVTALLILRSVTAAQSAKEAGATLRAQLALDAAEDMIAAERMFGKPGGPFDFVPAQTELNVDGVKVTVGMAAEDERLDINVAAPGVIDGALKAGTIAADARRRILTAILQRRNMEQRIGSVDDLVSLLTSAGGEEAGCLSGKFSPVAGSRTEDFPGAAARAVPLRSATAVRVKLSTDKGQKRTYIMRLGGQGSLPYVLDRFVEQAMCNELGGITRFKLNCDAC